MSTEMTLIHEKAKRAESAWGNAYPWFDRIVERRRLQTGAELGVGFGGHAKSLLTIPFVEQLYGIDPFEYRIDCQDPMNMPQNHFDDVHRFVLQRLDEFGDRYVHIRKRSVAAADDVPDQLDFVYIDADHSYEGIWSDLCAWFPKVREGGVIGGHDYGHVNFPGIQRAVDRFFGRFGWDIQVEQEGVWWVEPEPLHVSFVIPCYNCGETVGESVRSVVEANLQPGDEIVLVDDGSDDATSEILATLAAEADAIQIHSHSVNRGGGAARNTGVDRALHPLIFCLDADNVLLPGSVGPLKQYLIQQGADAAAFQEIRYFTDESLEVTHSWKMRSGAIELADQLSSHQVPGSSGNYLYTKQSWKQASGYPEYARSLDAWGFGLRQLATGARMMVLENTAYLHRYGHDSYWVRESKAGGLSLTALQLMMPYVERLRGGDRRYLFGRRGRTGWFDRLEQRPLRLKASRPLGTGKSLGQRLRQRVRALIAGLGRIALGQNRQ